MQFSTSIIFTVAMVFGAQAAAITPREQLSSFNIYSTSSCGTYSTTEYVSATTGSDNGECFSLSAKSIKVTEPTGACTGIDPWKQSALKRTC
jgi:hypothetical protein